MAWLSSGSAHAKAKYQLKAEKRRKHRKAAAAKVIRTVAQWRISIMSGWRHGINNVYLSMSSVMVMCVSSCQPASTNV
jgi:hypothetical protein